MKRISTDAEYLATGKIILDADGVPVDVSGPPLRVQNTVGTRVLAGDIMIHGDTGWRRIDSLVPEITSGKLYLRRENHRSFIRFDYVEMASGTTLTLPSGWWPTRTDSWPISNSSTDKIGTLKHRLTELTFNFTGTAVGVIEAPFTAIPTDWPAAQIGTPT